LAFSASHYFRRLISFVSIPLYFFRDKASVAVNDWLKESAYRAPKKSKDMHPNVRGGYRIEIDVDCQHSDTTGLSLPSQPNADCYSSKRRTIPLPPDRDPMTSNGIGDNWISLLYKDKTDSVIPGFRIGMG
jgi:hypothetical protein